MQINFPIVLRYDYKREYPIKEIGRICSTIWSIRPGWCNTTDQLTEVEIFRSDGYGRIDIELILRPCIGNPDKYIDPIDDSFKSSKSKVFKATLHNNEKVLKISTRFKSSKHERYMEFFGNVLVHSSLDNQSVVSTKPFSGPSSSSNCKTDNPSFLSPSKLSDDFLCLLDNPNSFADATLKCGTDEIRVHKNILSTRSPVLLAMFSSQMQEDLSSTVHITDIQLDVLHVTLRYIYGGKIDNLTDALAADLLFAADKYQLDELKSVCIAKLKTSVTVDNVSRVLVLGELHDMSLKTHAIDFLCRCDSFSELEEMEEWISLEKEYPRLALEVAKSMLSFYRRKK